MSNPTSELAATGVAGLDAILRGGLPRKRIYLLQGEPGVGKTTLGLQFLLEGQRLGERGLYVTLSETEEELRAVASSHGWALDGLVLHQLSSLEEMLQAQQQNTLFHPAEVELHETITKVLDLVERTRPLRVVFDSLSEMRLLAGDSLRYRRQILALKQHFAGRNSTVLFLDDGTANGGDLQLQSLAHGVIALEKLSPEYGATRRRLEVVKLRGVDIRSGKHDYCIMKNGLQVFPRLVALEHHKDFTREKLPSGVPELDALLGGGIERGSSTLLLGPAGTGKSSLAAQYIASAVQRQEHVAIFTFDENISTFFARASGMGLRLEQAAAEGRLSLRQVDPAELSPGEFAHLVRQAVEQSGARVVIIDSLNGYLMAMPDERHLIIQMHELLTYLAQQGVSTLLVVAQHGLVGSMQAPVDITYLADTVMLFRFFEAAGKVRKALSVLKKRTGTHEDTIREFQVDSDGVHVGPPLTGFRGILTGTPSYIGQDQALLKEQA
ncbi:ATPase domain-containing protein [Hyalangium rubrum]|uniref:non-specific serine/threonine protein kinase n=1 Tax=Hyalangium rubrum TaxID=3103134 RepID=A0ABU5H3D1_9BACT|nr:ATPase domain-containing protein [Hyalangium sp. s54d21]MDY7227632.1 ATPase domain-containing protein [Hyalangium sp. s54d21]